MSRRWARARTGAAAVVEQAGFVYSFWQADEHAPTVFPAARNGIQETFVELCCMLCGIATCPHAWLKTCLMVFFWFAWT